MKTTQYFKNGSRILRFKSPAAPLPSPDAMYVEFPDYQVKTGLPNSSGMSRMPLGHGMVIAVDENTGQTRGSEYGRYDPEEKGIARRVTVPNFKAKEPGNPTNEELNTYAEALNLTYGHTGGTTRIHYVKGANYNDMVNMMNSAEEGSRTGQRKGHYYIDHNYRLADHNCGTYGVSMIKKAMPWYKLSGFGLYSFGLPGGVHPYWGGTGEYATQ